MYYKQSTIILVIILIAIYSCSLINNTPYVRSPANVVERCTNVDPDSFKDGLKEEVYQEYFNQAQNLVILNQNHQI